MDIFIVYAILAMFWIMSLILIAGGFVYGLPLLIITGIISCIVSLALTIHVTRNM